MLMNWYSKWLLKVSKFF